MKVVLLFLLCLLIGENNCLLAQSGLGAYKGSGSVTQGAAGKVIQTNLLPGCNSSRISATGIITSTDSKEWVVPAEHHFLQGSKATDLYNDCSGVRLANIQALDIGIVPIVEIDPDGDVITGYLFGDNYFELYVNAKLVAVDPVPYTPFNSCVVRFKVKRPYTLAVRLIDWEENLGLGTESNKGNAYYAGDGGFIASFSDGTVTDNSWKAQTYYIAPIEDLGSIEEKADGTRSSSGATTTPACNGNCYAVHYPIPVDWNSITFNDQSFPAATVYTESVVGVDNKPAYTNFAQQFSGAGAKFIWSSNLILDNLVLMRKTVGTTTDVHQERNENTLMLSATPNPTQEVVTIEYSLPSEQLLRIDILDLLGNIVATQVDEVCSAGKHTLQWEAKNNNGIRLLDGTYILRLQGEYMHQSQIVFLLR